MLSLLCWVEQRCVSSTVYKIQPQHCDDHRLQLTGPWHDASAALLVLQRLPWPAHIGALHWHSHNTGHDAHSLWSRHPLQPLQATAGPDLQDGKLGDRGISSRSLRIPGWVFTDLFQIVFRGTECTVMIRFRLGLGFLEHWSVVASVFNNWTETDSLIE